MSQDTVGHNDMHDALAVSSSHFLGAIISACRPISAMIYARDPADQKSIRSRVSAKPESLSFKPRIGICFEIRIAYALALAAAMVLRTWKRAF